MNNRYKLAVVLSVVFMISCFYMLLCVVPSIYWGDSAELTTVVCTMGVAHSPGYPLFAQLYGLALFLPLKDFPFGLNIITVCLSSLAVVLTFFAVFKITSSFSSAFVASAILFFSKTFIMQSLYVEVYSLHIFLFLCSLCVLLCQSAIYNSQFTIHNSHSALPKSEIRNITCALFIISLGSCHHILMYFVFAVFLLWRFGIWLKKREITLSSIAYLLNCAFIMIVCSAIFLYLPLTSAREPFMDWWSPKTIENFKSLVSLRGYIYTFPRNILEIIERINIPTLKLEIGIFFLALALFIGIISSFKICIRISFFLFMTMLTTFIATLLVKHGKPEFLRLPVYIILSIYAGIGTNKIYRWLFAMKKIWFKNVLYFVFTVLVVFFLAANMLDMKFLFMSSNNDAHKLGYSLLSSINRTEEKIKNNILVTAGDYTITAVQYFKFCPYSLTTEKFRNTIFIPATFLSFDWFVEKLKKNYPAIYIPQEDSSRQLAVGSQQSSNYQIIKSPNHHQPSAISHQRSALRTRKSRPLFKFSDKQTQQKLMSLIEKNYSNNRIYTTFAVPPAGTFTTVPYGYVYKLAKTKKLSDLKKVFRQDFSPKMRWSKQDVLSKDILSSLYNERGKTYQQFGFQNVALVECDKALKLEPENAEALANKAFSIEVLGKTEQAIKLYKKAIVLAPANALLYYNLGNTYFRKRELDNAISMWMTSLMLDAKNASVYNNLGTAYSSIGEVDKAIKFYEQAIKIRPKYINAYINLSAIYKHLNDCGKAIEYMEKVRNFLPSNTDMKIAMAKLYYDCDLLKLCEEELLNVLRIEPQNTGAKVLLKELQGKVR